MNFGIIKKGGTRGDGATGAVHNRESVDINQGTPVIFVMDGTSDGCDIQLPSSSTANKASAFPAGIALATIKAGSSGNNVQAYGIAEKALVSATITRSATSAVWASAVGIAVGDILTVNTLANVLEMLSAGSAAKAANWQFNAVGTVVSVTTAASGSAGTYPPVNSLGGASSDTIAYVTSLAKVFVRTL